MRIGVVGLGKVGLTLALVLQHRGGHDVIGYDIDPDRVLARLADPADRGEAGLATLIAEGSVTVVDRLDELVEHAELVFVVVPTPHGPAYGGDQPAPHEPADFHYCLLVNAINAITDAAFRARHGVDVAVVSTVTPGTMRRELLPLTRPKVLEERSDGNHVVGDFVRLFYNPVFIALGTVVTDLLDPDFVLVGAEPGTHPLGVQTVWESLHDRPHAVMGIESAELTKMAYNVAMVQRITYANTLARLAHLAGADVGQVLDALELTRPRPARPGMVPGGPCLPRDLSAMSWLTRTLTGDTLRPPIGHDWFGALATAREDQSRWLADLVARWAHRTGLPVLVLGEAYKPGVPLPDGSPSRLLQHHLTQAGCARIGLIDPHRTGAPEEITRPVVAVIATPHPEFQAVRCAPGTVIVDPWGIMPDQPDVTVVRVGWRP